MHEKINERKSLVARKTASCYDKTGDQRHPSRLDLAELSWFRWWHVLCFTWVIPILSLGYKRKLTDADLDELSHEDKSSTLLNKMILYDWTTTSIWHVIIKVFWKEFIVGGILLLPFMAMRLVQPLLLQQIVLFIDDPQALPSTGYLYSIILLVCSVVPPFMFQQSFFCATRTGLRVRNALTSLIYTRLLSTNAASLQKTSASHAINLAATDTTKFLDASIYLHFLWEGPLEVVISFGLLCWTIGLLPALCGYIVLILIILVQMLSSRKFAQYHHLTAICTDKRIEALRELIDGSQIMKMYNWEEPLEKRVHSMRQNELTSIQKTCRLRAVNTSLSFALIPLITLGTFSISWSMGHPLKATDIFTAASIFGVVRSPIARFLPTAIEKLMQIQIAAKRIDMFMRLQSRQQDILHPSDIDDQQKNKRIIFRDATFSWQDNEICLSSLDIDIAPGSLVSIMGEVGSGKSSLFAAILGEMHLIGGQMSVSGSSLSYASQSAWIFPDTLRANILLDKPLDRQRYMNVMRACCLDVDLNTFGSSGDLMMIGDKGVNLSGGQKARVSLARALYIDADVYLLDDPLAAVDTKVAKQIYDQCIGPHGLLNKKTRLLITHKTQYLIDSHQILYLSQGYIRSQDRLDELRSEYETFDRMNEEANPETKLLTDTLDIRSSIVDSRPIIEDEIWVEGNVSWSVWRDLFTGPPSGWFGLCLLSVFFLIGQILYDSANIWLGIRLKEHYADQQRPSPFLYIYIVLTLGTLLMGAIRANYFFHIFLNGTKYLHNRMLGGLVNTSMRFYESNPSGRILNRATRDQQVVDETLPMAIFDCAQSLLMTLGSAIVISLVNPWIFFVLIPFIAVAVMLSRVYMGPNYQLKRLESVTRSPVHVLFASSWDGLVTIRALKVKDYFLQSLTNRIDANTRAYITMIGVASWFSLLLDFINNLFSVTAIAISVILRDQLDPSLTALLLMYSITVKAQFQWGVRQGVEAQLLMTSAERINEYSQLPREEDLGGQQRLISTATDWPERGSIEFRNYSLRYRVNLEPALKNINLRVEPGEKIGIIGRTGAGKSSLIQGLFRLVDRSVVTGEILIDDIDISRITLTHLRSHLSVIPQQPVLFSGTLRYNLDPSDHCSDEQCWMALEAVQLKNLVSNRPEGLLLRVAESGINFSAGQCQLICAARAILKQSRILLIDEATANVDQETDVLFQKVIAEKFQDRTVLTIAHRLDTVVQSDRILILNKGQVENLDEPKNILHRSKQ